MNIRTTALAGMLCAVAFGAFAQGTATPKIDAEQARQEARIDQGVTNGQLTPHETKKLDAQQGRISRTEARAKADGTVTPAEKAHIAHMQRKASQDIKHQKHDTQVAATKAAVPAVK